MDALDTDIGNKEKQKHGRSNNIGEEARDEEAKEITYYYSGRWLFLVSATRHYIEPASSNYFCLLLPLNPVFSKENILFLRMPNAQKKEERESDFFFGLTLSVFGWNDTGGEAVCK